MSKSKANRRRRSTERAQFVPAVLETLGLGMVIGSLLATLGFVALQAYHGLMRK